MGYREMGHVMECAVVKKGPHFAALMAIAYHQRGEYGVCTAAKATLAAEARLGESTLYRALSDLTCTSGPRGYGVAVVSEVQGGGGRGLTTGYRINLAWLVEHGHAAEGTPSNDVDVAPGGTSAEEENPPAERVLNPPAERIQPETLPQREGNPPAERDKPVLEPVRTKKRTPREQAREAVGLLTTRLDPALAAAIADEAADRAEAAAGPSPPDPGDLRRAALCLGLTGVPQADVAADLDALDVAVAVAVLTVALRTGEKPRPGPRRNYVRTLVADLLDKQTASRYAQDADPDTRPDGPASAALGGPRGGSTSAPNARERANGVSGRDLERSGLNTLAILRARREGGAGPAEDSA